MTKENALKGHFVKLSVGSLCSGIDGLALGAERAGFGPTLWQSEVDPAASEVLAARWPGVPNLGDLLTVDWSAVEPVDLLVAGYPCQPFSHAGQRKGTDDARHLWPGVCRAIRLLRPRRVLLENVAGHLSLGFGDVLGDLAQIGYDTEWTCIRASDVGAPHRRERVFIAAADSDGPDRRGWPSSRRIPATVGARAQAAAPDASGERRSQDAGGAPGSEGQERRGRGHHIAGRDGAAGSAPGGDREDLAADAECPGRKRAGVDHAQPQPRQRGERLARRVAWGAYEPAIRRWEGVLGRSAPDPVDERGRLNPPFVEWMMGFEPEWVTGGDVRRGHGLLGRNAVLRLLGNSVVPQVAEVACRLLLTEVA